MAGEAANCSLSLPEDMCSFAERTWGGREGGVIEDRRAERASVGSWVGGRFPTNLMHAL